MIASSNDDAINRHFEAIVKEFFTMRRYDGPVLKYLNVRIVQTELGISIDQTEHIIDKVLKPFFPENERVNPVINPWDPDLEEELYTAPVQEGRELKEVEQEYGGSTYTLGFCEQEKALLSYLLLVVSLLFLFSIY